MKLHIASFLFAAVGAALATTALAQGGAAGQRGTGGVGGTRGPTGVGSTTYSQNAERGTVVVRRGDDEIVVRFGAAGQKPRVEINGEAVDGGDWQPATGAFSVSGDGYDVRATTPSGSGFITWSGASEALRQAAAQQKRPHIGVQVGSLPPALAEHLELDPERTVLVVGVTENGPAAKAGLRAHDVLLRIDGNDEVTAETLRDAVAGKKAGDRIALTVLRRGERQAIEVTVGEETVPGMGLYSPFLDMTKQNSPYVLGWNDSAENRAAWRYLTQNANVYSARDQALRNLFTATRSDAPKPSTKDRGDEATLESLQEQVRAIREQCEALLRQLERQPAKKAR